MRLTLIATLATLTATPALSADWNIRPWDTRLSPAQITARIHGQSVTFPDGATATYEATGAYSYTYQGGNRFEGTWEMAEDGAICTTFSSGHDRCDLYVLQGDTLMLINESGGRFLTAN